MIVMKAETQVDIEIEGKGTIPKGTILYVTPQLDVEGKADFNKHFVVFHHFGWLHIPAKIFLLNTEIGSVDTLTDHQKN